MTWILLSIVGLVLAALPAVMFMKNLPLFQEQVLEKRVLTPFPQVSVLIPARDEAAGIAETVRSVLQSEGVTVEVLVLDDHSRDNTAAIVHKIAEQDPRVRCAPGRPLPDGWNGKQFACYQLAKMATFSRLVFLDADVRVGRDALLSLTRRQDDTGVPLLSIFPHQQTETWLEQWLIPLMHWILLGFLPFRRMRQSTHPAYAAGCGQLFMAQWEDYQRAGTHAAIRHSRHDGVKLPKAFREAGLMTDVLDGSQLAECRMYHSGREVIRGVLKNAVEGIANPKLIVPASMVLLGGAVLPWVTLVGSLLRPTIEGTLISLTAIWLSYQPRLVAVGWLGQPPLAALCHPFAVSLLLALQWLAFLQSIVGRQVAWRGRN